MREGTQEARRCVLRRSRREHPVEGEDTTPFGCGAHCTSYYYPTLPYPTLPYPTLPEDPSATWGTQAWWLPWCTKHCCCGGRARTGQRSQLPSCSSAVQCSWLRRETAAAAVRPYRAILPQYRTSTSYRRMLSTKTDSIRLAPREPAPFHRRLAAASPLHVGQHVGVGAQVQLGMGTAGVRQGCSGLCKAGQVASDGCVTLACRFVCWNLVRRTCGNLTV
jgi:hypothetical protein